MMTNVNCPFCEKPMKVANTDQVYRLECESDECSFAMEVDRDYHHPAMMAHLSMATPHDWHKKWLSSMGVK